jgi:protein TonB
MKYPFLLLLMICCSVLNAQKITQERDEDIILKSELSAQFPGGENAWVRFVEKNFDMSTVQSALPDSINEFSDSLIVRFIINKKGLIEGPEFAAGGSTAFKNAVAALLKKSPAWQPEIQGSGPVKSYVCYQFTWFFVADYGGVVVKRAKFPTEPSH